MGWDPVPWMVENGALHSASLARKFAYAAVGGNEGIVGPMDLEVRQLAVAGTKIRVYPGLAAIKNRASGALNEMYLGSMLTEEEVDIVATGGGGPRSDMICARVENPWLSGEPWADPPSVPNGPYIKTVVISNVGSSAVVPPPGNGNALIPLARIDLPASTATVIQSYITDLRFMANSLEESQLLIVPVPGQHSLLTSQNTYITWPNPPMNSQTVKVPEWATRCLIDGTVAVVQMGAGGNARGDMRAVLGSQVTGAMQWDYDNSSAGADRGNLVFGGSIAVPAAYRGTTQAFKTEARGYTVASGNTAPIYAELYSTVIARIKFQAAPASNV